MKPQSLAVLLLLALAVPVRAQTAPIEITGATRVEIDERSGVWRLTGAPVTVRRGTIVLRAPVIIYNITQQVVEATGGVTYIDPTAELTSTIATVWLADERLVAAGDVTGMLRSDSGETRLRADRIEAWRKERRLVATGAVTLARAAVTVSGERIDYDDTRQTAAATGRPSVTASGATMTANRIDAALATEELTAVGNVQIRKDDLEAASPHAVVRNREGMATLTGGVTVRRGQAVMTAPTVVVNLTTNTVTATGGATLTLPPP